MASAPLKERPTPRERMATAVELCAEILKLVPAASRSECVQKVLQLVERPNGVERARNLARRLREGRIKIRPVSLDEVLSWV